MKPSDILDAPIDLKFQEALQRADAAYQWAKRDWERHFSHRMDFDEYMVIQDLNGLVWSYQMSVEQARQHLKEYRERKK